MKIFRRWLRKTAGPNPQAEMSVPPPSAGRESLPSFDPTPDQPEPFGYKVSWFAVKAADPASVLNALELGEGKPANWASGMASMYESARGDDRWAFVSPSLNGWVLAICSDWPYPTIETHHDIGKKFDLLFTRLMKRFDDVQFFGSHRVVDYAAWARAVDGAPTRIFSWNGSEGAVFMNFGDQTREEAELGLVDLTGLSPQDAGDRIFSAAEEQDEKEDEREGDSRGAFPDEEAVVDLAALWSIDPTKLPEQGHPPGLGLLARVPKDLRQ